MNRQKTATEALLDEQRRGVTGAHERTPLQSTAKSSWGTRAAFIAVGVVVVVAAIVGVVIFALSGKSKDGQLCEWDSWQLPRPDAGPRPLAYTWDVAPQLHAPYNFTGVLTASLNSGPVATRCIVLNSHGLELQSIKFSGPSDSLRDVASASTVPEHDLLIIALPAPVPPDTLLSLRIEYSGALATNNLGFYRSLYTGADSEQQVMLGCLFEATYARRAFPCWDDPLFKAKYTVVVRSVPADMTAVSNMPVARKQLKLDGTSDYTFDVSPPMSSYLAQLVVGKLIRANSTAFHSIPDANGHLGSYPVSVYAREGQEANVQYALHTAVTVLEYFEQYFGSRFPLPKMDLIALPDLAPGALECWGAIVYRETALLANASSSSTAALQRVDVVVAHELAHQLLGNLVTIADWGELWLNEGGATFYEYLGTNKARPAFDIWSQWLPNDPQTAMATDGHAATHALKATGVVTPAQIEAQFDSIAYSKGGTILRMLSVFLNSVRDRAWNDGMQAYITRYAYGNPTSAQLFDELAAAIEQPGLQPLMQQWATQAGVPVVVVGPAPAGGGAGVLSVSQQRFFQSSASAAQAGSEVDTVWWIPLSWRTAATGMNGSTLPSQTFTDTELPGGLQFDPATDAWVKLNVDQTGYYRAAYTGSMWAALRGRIIDDALGLNLPLSTLTADDRSGLLNDLAAAAFAGLAPAAHGDDVANISTLLAHLDTLAYETSYTVWLPGLSTLGKLYGLMYGDDAVSPATSGAGQACIDAMAARAQTLLRPIIAALGWQPAQGSTPEVPARTFLRTAVLRAGVKYGVPSVLEEAGSLWSAWRAGKIAELDPDIRRIVYEAAVSVNGTGAWQVLQTLYATLDNDAAHRRDVAGGMVAAKDPALLAKTAEWALSSAVRVGDTPTVLAGVGANPAGRAAAWQVYQVDQDQIMREYGSGGFSLAEIVTYSSSYFTTQAALDSITAWFKSRPVPAAELEVSRALEDVAARVEFVANNMPSLCAELGA